MLPVAPRLTLHGCCKGTSRDSGGRVSGAWDQGESSPPLFPPTHPPLSCVQPKAGRPLRQPSAAGGGDLRADDLPHGRVDWLHCQVGAGQRGAVLWCRGATAVRARRPMLPAPLGSTVCHCCIAALHTLPTVLPPPPAPPPRSCVVQLHGRRQVKAWWRRAARSMRLASSPQLPAYPSSLPCAASFPSCSTSFPPCTASSSLLLLCLRHPPDAPCSVPFYPTVTPRLSDSMLPHSLTHTHL